MSSLPERLSRQSVFCGLHGVEMPDSLLDLGNGFSLSRPNERILSACEWWMTHAERAEPSAEAYLFYESPPQVRAEPWDNLKRTFQNGLLAFQIIKPIKTCGTLFCVLSEPDSPLSVQNVEHRQIMEPGGWALLRRFDKNLLDEVPEAIREVLTVMDGEHVERKNAFYLLQLGLEHFHPLIAGLLWVMGMDAIFDSGSGEKFKRTLCSRLGPSAKIFPAWNPNQPDYTVEGTTLHLYTLRSKVAHGRDLREARSDGKFDLLQEYSAPDGDESLPYAMVLCEAACYLLCEVLRKQIESVIKPSRSPY